jgi:hypothetical protein
MQEVRWYDGEIELVDDFIFFCGRGNDNHDIGNQINS